MNAGLPNGGEEVAEQVAMRAGVHRIPGEAPVAGRLLAWPEGEAIVMFGGQHHVPGAGLFDEPGPFIGIE